jgi:hypothetical protein
MQIKMIMTIVNLMTAMIISIIRLLVAAIFAGMDGEISMTMMGKWWVSLYDPDDRLIAYYRIDGDTTIDRIAATFIFKHSNIEYFKITVNPPK